MSDLCAVAISVNGVTYERTVESRLLLADFLRHTLGLTGTHIGCEHGVCGACTVMLDGDSVRSCLMFAVQANGCRVETVESLGSTDRLSPLQEAFREHHGLQCGFCTPGMITRAYRLLQENPNPSETEIRHGIAGNLCRCTGYLTIVRAIRAAAKRMANVEEAVE